LSDNHNQYRKKGNWMIPNGQYSQLFRRTNALLRNKLVRNPTFALECCLVSGAGHFLVTDG
jgi:hypothetical protein